MNEFQVTRFEFLPVYGVRFRLSRIFDVWFVQEILNTQQDLFDRYSWPPVFLLV